MHHGHRRGLPGLALVLSGVVLTTLIARPAPTLASTNPESPPPPCAFGTSTAVAGTSVEISGPISAADASVEIAVEGSDKRIHQATVATIDGRWRSVLLFGAGDAGLWTVHVTINGADACQSPITVTLPAGVVAPPTEPPVAPAANEVEPPRGFDGADLRGLAVEAVVVLVVGSWIFLALVGVATILGARPLVRPWLRRIVLPATFLAVWGGLMVVVLFVDLAVSMGHFDTGTPPGDQALIDAAIWVAAVGGAILGTLAALRVREKTRSTAS